MQRPARSLRQVVCGQPPRRRGAAQGSQRRGHRQHGKFPAIYFVQRSCSLQPAARSAAHAFGRALCRCCRGETFCWQLSDSPRRSGSMIRSSSRVPRGRCHQTCPPLYRPRKVKALAPAAARAARDVSCAWRSRRRTQAVQKKKESSYILQESRLQRIKKSWGHIYRSYPSMFRHEYRGP